MFKFNNFISEPNVCQFYTDSAILPCNSNSDESSFPHKDRGHILNRNLIIIKNREARKISYSSPNVCKHKTINFSETKESIFHDLNQCISFRCNLKAMPEETFS